MWFRVSFLVLQTVMLGRVWCSEIVELNVNCVYMMQSWAFVENSYACVENQLIVESRNQFIAIVNKKPAKDHPYRDFKLVEFTSTVIKFIPKGLERFYPDLEGLAVYHSSLQEIDKSDLKPFPKLKMLHLAYNDIEVLPSDLFEYSSELRHMNFHTNKLKTVGNDILKQLQKLEVAYFDNNPCIKESARKENLPALITKLSDSCKQ